MDFGAFTSAAEVICFTFVHRVNSFFAGIFLVLLLFLLWGLHAGCIALTHEVSKNFGRKIIRSY
jgi:hypothetical protein